jgi:uncharacterized protein (TIRG00374 family)
VAIYLLAMCVRSVLWQRLLPTARSTATLFRVIILGFAVSYLLPLRIGELARAALMKRWCGIDYGTTLASLVAERVLDGLCVSGLLLVALAFVPAPPYVSVLAMALAAIFGGIATLLMVASWRLQGLLALAAFVGGPLPRRPRDIVQNLTHGFAHGLEPLRKWRALPGLVLLSLVGWLCQFTVFYLLMLAFRVPASVPTALLDGGVANFATLLPSAPGFVGTFDATLIKLLMDIQGVSVENATAYVLAVHSVLVVPIIVLAAALLWRTDLSLIHLMSLSLSARQDSTPPWSGDSRQPRTAEPASHRSRELAGSRASAFLQVPTSDG